MCIQGVPGGKVNILGGHCIGHSKPKCLYEHVSYSERYCIVLYCIVLPSRRAAPLSEACESVWSVSWLLWLLVVTLLECCEKCRTSSQMPNMLIWCMFMASAMVVPLPLLKNSVNGFLCAEFQIVDCVTRCSIHCVNAVRFPLLMFHLNGHVNKTWRNRKTFLIWYSVALLLAREDLQHVSVFHEHVYGEHCMKTACTHFTHSLCKIYTQGTVPCV